MVFHARICARRALCNYLHLRSDFKEKMNIWLAYHRGDERITKEWMLWCAELGITGTHTLYLNPAKHIADSTEMVALAEKVFSKVVVRRDYEDLNKWPAGPNSAMRQACVFFETNQLGPFFFTEPDCIPLLAESFDLWEEEYRRGGKPFMGRLVPAFADSSGGLVPAHCTGNMMCPQNSMAAAPRLTVASDVAFDVYAAREVLPKCHLTTLIQHVFNTLGNPPTFPDQKSLSLLQPGAAFFHRCKDGSLIERLRELRESPPVFLQQCLAIIQSERNGTNKNSGNITGSIVLKLMNGENETHYSGEVTIRRDSEDGDLQTWSTSEQPSRRLDVRDAARIIQQHWISTIVVTKNGISQTWQICPESESSKKSASALCSALIATEKSTGPIRSTPSKPKVHTYYAVVDSMCPEEQRWMIEKWKNSWSENGWEPVVLGPIDVQIDPEVAKAFASIPTINPKEYELACWHRWLAMRERGGLLVDYDVLPYGFMATTEPPHERKLRLFDGYVPCAVWGTCQQYREFCELFLSTIPKGTTHWSDMLAMEKLQRFYDTGNECVEYGKPGWKEAKLVHYAHGVCKGRKRSELIPEAELEKLGRLPILKLVAGNGITITDTGLSITDQFRACCQEMVKIMDGKPGRKQMLYAELRKAGIGGFTTRKPKRRKSLAGAT